MKKLARLLSLVLALVLCASVSMAAAEETELPKGDWYVGFSNFSIGNSCPGVFRWKPNLRPMPIN